MKTILFLYRHSLPEYKLKFIHELECGLSDLGYHIIFADEILAAAEVLKSNARLCSLVIDWDHFELGAFHEIAKYNSDLPVFALGSKHYDIELTLHDFDLNLDFIEYDATLSEADVLRIDHEIQQYFQAILPPFTRQLMHYVEENNYSFCTPGHQQGLGFQRSPVGAAFYDYLGPNIFKTDISISMDEMGSLLDHSGPHKDAEQYISSVFNSDRSLVVTNGTSTSNKVVGMYAAGVGDTILIDRNCHKSLTHLMMMVDVNPIYLKPTRNAHGIIGGIPQSEFSKESIQAKIDAHPVVQTWPVYAVVTNSTYDGIFYNVNKIHEMLDIKNLHFDSAWCPYTNFHPIYKGKYGMGITPKAGHTIYETQSTHKLLAAFSQASMIHIKGAYDEERLNEAFMMHTSTSPFYPIVASCEVSAAMMDGKPGRALINECIQSAMDFRREIIRLKGQSDSWSYDIWQPDNIETTKAWSLDTNAGWHGYQQVDDDHLYLDPVKVTVLLPGIKNNEIQASGIPANIVAAFLEDHGVVVEKTGPYCILFLFSVGINRAKAMRLLAVLNKFKQIYDQNLPVKQVLPSIYKNHPEFYADKTIQDIAKIQHALMMKHKLTEVMYHAFDTLPEYGVSPHQAYQKLVKGCTKKIRVDDLKGHTSAVMVLPYPPGIPVIMPGERITDESYVIVEFLIMLEEIGSHLPGFEIDIHGLKKGEDGKLYIKVLECELRPK